MARDQSSSRRLASAADGDPRDVQGAEIIHLATRSSLPQVTQRRPRSDALTALGGLVFVVLLGAGTLWSLNSARTGAHPDEGGPGAEPLTSATPLAAPAPAVPPLGSPGVSVPPPLQRAGAAVQPVGAAAPAVNPYSSPTVVFDAGSAAVPLTVSGSPVGPSGAATGPGTDDFAARLGTPGTGAAVAAASIDPKTTITQGTLIPAVLETAINTDVPGYVRAVVSADVRSFDGSRVLVPRSARLVGQYKSGMQAGQKRAYVIWTRLIRPDGVAVNLGSPAVAFGGETGIAGKVDSHFFERFGSAMLLSIVGGLSAIGTGGASVVIGAGSQSAAAAAVGQTGQIGPTVRVRQGEPIRVFTARDLDFSKVSTE